jgi:hypothetical protein
MGKNGVEVEVLRSVDYDIAYAGLVALLFAQHRHFSVTRYSLRSSRFWSTEAVIYASNIFQSIGLLPPPVFVLHRCCVCVIE